MTSPLMSRVKEQAKRIAAELVALDWDWDTSMEEAGVRTAQFVLAELIRESEGRPPRKNFWMVYDDQGNYSSLFQGGMIPPIIPEGWHVVEIVPKDELIAARASHAVALEEAYSRKLFSRRKLEEDMSKLREALEKIVEDELNNDWEDEAMRMHYIAVRALAETSPQ